MQQPSPIFPEIVIVKGKKQVKIPPQKKARAVAGISVLKDVYSPACVGHTSFSYTDMGGSTSYIINDFLVDSSGISKGGESVNQIVQIGLNAFRKMVISVTPEACKKRFKVVKPAGIKRGTFGFSFGRQALHPAVGGGGFYEAYPVVVTFNNLTGAAPTVTYAYFFITNGVNNSFQFIILGEFSNNFAFSDIQIAATYPFRNLLPEIDFYRIRSSGYLIPVGDNANFVMFSYTSPTGKDIGPIISIT